APDRAAAPHNVAPPPVAALADVLRGCPDARIAEAPLARLDRLPSLLERREVPAFALAAHDPEAAAIGVEGEAPADREVLHDFVRAERLVAEHAGRVHGAPSPGTWAFAIQYAPGDESVLHTRVRISIFSFLASATAHFGGLVRWRLRSSKPPDPPAGVSDDAHR